MIDINIKNYEDIFKLFISYIIGGNNLGSKNIFNYFLNIYSYFKNSNNQDDQNNNYYKIVIEIFKEKNIDLPDTVKKYSKIFPTNIYENDNLENYYSILNKEINDNLDDNLNKKFDINFLKSN
jgi:hypothetical protein